MSDESLQCHFISFNFLGKTRMTLGLRLGLGLELGAP